MSYERGSGNRSLMFGGGCAGIALVLAIIAFVFLPGLFGYVFHGVDATEIGLKLSNGKLVEIVGPGVYTAPFEMFTDIKNVNISGVSFQADDPEVLTQDLQRIGVLVSGQVFRPGLGVMDPEKWSSFRTIYENDAELDRVIKDQARQAMKVCVGGKTFEEAAVGTNRNDLRECIDSELTALTAEMGLTIRNLVVPDIVLSDQSKNNLDALTNSRQQTLLAEQDELKAAAEGSRDLAVRQAAIRVTEGEKQETLRQEAISADLQRQVAEAQNAVIDAQKENELLIAQRDKEIADARLLVAQVNAQAEVAEELALANIISGNEAYGDYLETQSLAQAVTSSELIISPNGNPLLMFGNQEVPVTVQVPQ